MAYIGNNLKAAYRSYKIIDDISSSFNGVLTTFALEVSGTTPVPFPINPQQCLISVNGVVLEPDPTGTSGFNLVGTNIVFVTPPTNGHSFFGVILAGADYVNVGVIYPSGSESVPSISFDSDLDTGIYNPAANELSIVTGGTSRIKVTSGGQVGIGIAPTSPFHVNGDIKTEGQFLGALSGNSTTASSLQSSQTFALTGDITGTTNSDLSSGLSIVTTIATGSVSTTELGGDITTAGKALLDDVDVAAQRTTLGLATVASTGEYSDLLNIPPVGGGSVTSVALTAPTGFVVNGSPVTTNGTLAITYASGYQGYTTTEATKLSGIADGAEVNVQSDWNATTGDSLILNKPTFGAAAFLNVGTSAGTVAAGNDARFHDAVTLAGSISDVLTLSGQQISTTNPGSDQLVFWDDNNSKITYLALGTNLSITGTTLNASVSTGTITNSDISATAAIDFSKLAALPGGQIIIGNNLNVPTAATISGDITFDNTGIASIGSGVIVDSDISSTASIAFSKLAPLTNGQIIIGNSSNVPAAVSVTGDITISNTGVTSIASGAIVNSDIDASAAIAFSKLASLSSGQIIIGNVSNIPTATSVSGDIAISNTGVTSIVSGVIVDSDISSTTTISASKIQAGSVSNVGVVQLNNTVTSTSTTQAATANAVKTAYDLASSALTTSGGTITGTLEIGNTGSLVFEGSSVDGFETTIAVANPTADRTIIFPNVTGNVVTTGDSGTVTGNMIANGAISNAEINTSAAIAFSKLAALPSGRIIVGNSSSVPTAVAVSGDITLSNTGVAAIASGVIVDADINASAAISGGKIQSATTSNAGVVQLNNTVTSTSTSQAGTANAVKTAYDLASAAMPTAGGQFTGDVVIGGANKLTIGTSTSTGGQKLKIQGQVGNSNAGAIAVLARGNLPFIGDYLGSISFRDNSEYVGAEISAISLGWTAGSSYPTALGFSTTSSGSTTPTIRMSIDQDGQTDFYGNVRISDQNVVIIGANTSTGDQKLKIQGRVSNSNGGAIAVLARGNTPGSAGQPLGTISFRDQNETRGAEIHGETDSDWAAGNYGGRLRFATTPNQGSAPADRWEINKEGQLVSIDQGGGIDCAPIYSNTTSGNTANVYIGPGGVLQRADGSSIKYKKEVETIQDSYADAILDCRPVWYRSICKGDRPDHSFWGFIAEEVAEIDPRLVHFKTVDVTFENGAKVETPCDPEPESVHYNRFVPHLVNLVRRQRDQIQSLEDRILALENS